MNTKKHLVLIVEDDIRLSQINSYALESEGYAVQAVYSLAQARKFLTITNPDVILLDVKLPDGDSFELCRAIRGKTDAHIIFLTSVTTSKGEMEGLLAGGDDYLRKPYDIDLLRRRVAIGIRRKGSAAENPAPVTQKGNMTLDTVATQAYVNGVSLELTRVEFSMLLLFARHEDEVLGADFVYGKVWATPMGTDKRAIQRRLSDLRCKLLDGGCDYAINTVYGKGYCFTKANVDN